MPVLHKTLRKAFQAGDVKRVKHLFEIRDIPDSQVIICAREAVLANQLGMARLLLPHIAGYNATMDALLNKAAKLGHDRMLLLITQIRPPERPAMQRAALASAAAGHQNCLDILLLSGNPEDRLLALEAAATNNQSHIVKSLMDCEELSPNERKKALLAACLGGADTVVDLLSTRKSEVEWVVKDLNTSIPHNPKAMGAKDLLEAIVAARNIEKQTPILQQPAKRSPRL